MYIQSLRLEPFRGFAIKAGWFAVADDLKDLKDTQLNGACTITLSVARAQRKERARQFEAASDDKSDPLFRFHIDSTLS